MKSYRDETTHSSLSRFKISDEHLVSDYLVKEEIAKSFAENRCFEFYVDSDIVAGLKSGNNINAYSSRLIEIRNSIYSNISKGDRNIESRLSSDIRLSYRIMNVLEFVHIALADGDFGSLITRRFIIVKERPGCPTLFHISKETTVVSHIGGGPLWTEIPTIYLGLKIFDTLEAARKKGDTEFFKAFKLLLMIEERAIETGYNHSTAYPPEVSRALSYLVDELINYSAQFELEEHKPEKKVKGAKLTREKIHSIVMDLDARVKGDELNFDYVRNMKGIKTLESLARRYKGGDDIESLREVIRLLVASSGHDIHEVRNLANIILERIFSPKDFDAPLAARFINLHAGDSYNFEFALPEDGSKYFLRICSYQTDREMFLDKDVDFIDLPLEYTGSSNKYACTHLFGSYGHYDFMVVRKKGKGEEWPLVHGTSGRVNVIPDVRGNIILEIFTDIHGHTKSYWQDENGHTGLVYNEHGEVIRLGKFSDITAHLDDIKNRYLVTVIYLLGVQKRGTNREDWANEASSPSPFSPMSLVEIEPRLGGEHELKELVKKAHSVGIRIIVDIVPHINRRSSHLSDEYVVFTYDGGGHLTPRASTDGRYGSWNDGKLLNYRKFEVWEWLADSINSLVNKFDIDGIRFDSAHAVPIMMKRNNYTYVYDKKRSHEEMLDGNIIVNDREYDHFVTTGYYDSACRDIIAVPLHYFLSLSIDRNLRRKKKDFFLYIAECFWGHERFLSRSGIIPYNASLFKICENIIHGKSDVREIYHIYDNYFPNVLPEGTELLGILGNHDERRALNTFGHRGLRAAVGITSFMSNIIMDYEGSAEGEGWKVFLDNIYVNWNQFEYAAHRSLDGFYQEWYNFHTSNRGQGYLVWGNNNMVAVAAKFCGDLSWIGSFNFSDTSQNVSIQFDNPKLPICDDDAYRISDPLYSTITKVSAYYTGAELKISKINTVVPYTDRVKLLKLEKVDLEGNYESFLKDSFIRLCGLSDTSKIMSNFFFSEFSKNSSTFEGAASFLMDNLSNVFGESESHRLGLCLKRSFFHLYKRGLINRATLLQMKEKGLSSENETIRSLSASLVEQNRRGSLVFMSAEADPFSKSGGLANVVFELPKELVRLGEKVYVITGYYKNGDDKVMKKMNEAIKKYDIKYTGKNVNFKMMDWSYSVGVHYGEVEGVGYFLLDHHEFFDGLYWGYTGAEKIRKRVAFARACAEVILTFDLNTHYTFTNDAFAGIFNGIIRSDPYYSENPVFKRNKFLHIIHNGGWQYFDSYNRWENGFDLFNFFNIQSWKFGDFSDPVFSDRINCMATGIRFADRTITVSPSYAKQIEFACDGLERILRNVLGISNAIGTDFKERIKAGFTASKFVENNYQMLLEKIKGDRVLHSKIESSYPEILKGVDFPDKIADEKRKYTVLRMRNKLLLQLQRGLRVDPDLILITMIHRISEQKGFQLLLDASEGIFKNLGFQAIIGGAISSGDRRGEEIAHGLYSLSQFYPEMVSVNFGFQDVSVPLLSTDIFCMPSMHEPGGISQIEAFAAGALVVARATGGLRDTVIPVRVSGDRVDGNGFLFTDFTPHSFYDAMERASMFFRNSSQQEIFMARKNAEDSVYYWDKPARQYLDEIYSMTETIRFID